jgi:hypothetical protein
MKTILGSRTSHYLKRLGIFLIAVAFVVGIVGCDGNGNGNGDPYADYIKIYDWNDLDAVRDNLVEKYVLMNNLDSGTAGYDTIAGPTANEGEGWEPIGDATLVVGGDPLIDFQFVPGYAFYGTFDGNGHEIRDLFIDREYDALQGLFKAVESAGTITDVGVMDADITGSDGSACLVGASLGTVSECYSSGTVFVDGFGAGGLLGGIQGDGSTVSDCYSSASVNCTALGAGGLLVVVQLGGTVTDSYATGNVRADYTTAGGLLAFLEDGDVINCYATGDVETHSEVGGLVASVGQNGTVSKCYASGVVTSINIEYEPGLDSGDKAGGLVGNNNGHIVDSYATGAVSGDTMTGGLVGLISWDEVYEYGGTIDKSYSTGLVTNTVGVNETDEHVGGLVGLDDTPELEPDAVTDSFWDTETSGQLTSDGGTGKTTAEMKTESTFTGAGWDFTTTWEIATDSYPNLQWEP